MEVIVAAATALVEQKGYNNFSMRELAQELHCKAASLYNHIEGIDDINREIGRIASDRLNASLERATKDKDRDRAIEALAHEYRSFVKTNYELYRAILGLPALKMDDSLKLGRESLEVIRKVVRQYSLSSEDEVNFSRCFRGTLHGFVSFEMAGYYSGRKVHVDESFRFMIKGYIDWINRMEREKNGKTGAE